MNKTPEIVSRHFTDKGRENYDKIKWHDDDVIEETIYDVNELKKKKCQNKPS